MYKDGKQEWLASEYIGNGPRFSNNVAEYAGLIAVLRYLRVVAKRADLITIYGDSNLVVQQMNSKWKARSGLYLDWFSQARSLLSDLKLICPVTILWIPREENEMADQLCRDALPADALH